VHCLRGIAEAVEEEHGAPSRGVVRDRFGTADDPPGTNGESRVDRRGERAGRATPAPEEHTSEQRDCG
jgi:hypothetical protein